MNALRVTATKPFELKTPQACARAFGSSECASPHARDSHVSLTCLGNVQASTDITLKSRVQSFSYVHVYNDSVASRIIQRRFVFYAHWHALRGQAAAEFRRRRHSTRKRGEEHASGGRAMLLGELEWKEAGFPLARSARCFCMWDLICRALRLPMYTDISSAPPGPSPPPSPNCSKPAKNRSWSSAVQYTAFLFFRLLGTFPLRPAHIGCSILTETGSTSLVVEARREGLHGRGWLEGACPI
eukprot:3500852-Rhodomonas_salina.2